MGIAPTLEKEDLLRLVRSITPDEKDYNHSDVLMHRKITALSTTFEWDNSINKLGELQLWILYDFCKQSIEKHRPKIIL